MLTQWADILSNQNLCKEPYFLQNQNHILMQMTFALLAFILVIILTLDFFFHSFCFVYPGLVDVPPAGQVYCHNQSFRVGSKICLFKEAPWADRLMVTPPMCPHLPSRLLVFYLLFLICVYFIPYHYKIIHKPIIFCICCCFPSSWI